MGLLHIPMSNTTTHPSRVPLSFHLPFAVQPCPVPPRISNGDHDGHGTAEFTMGMYVTYTCNLGYYLAGNVERVFCKASGKWSQPSPRCEGTRVHCHPVCTLSPHPVASTVWHWHDTAPCHGTEPFSRGFGSPEMKYSVL